MCRVDAEYHNKTLTRVFGSPRAGCYFLAFCIFSCGLFRDHLCVFPPYSPFHDRSYSPQVPKRTSGPAAPGAPPRAARDARPRRALRRGADARAELDVGARRNGDVPRRLLRHSHGRACRGLPVQRPPRPDVRRQHAVLRRDCALVRLPLLKVKEKEG
jgi:hypothetical protein